MVETPKFDGKSGLAHIYDEECGQDSYGWADRTKRKKYEIFRLCSASRSAGSRNHPLEAAEKVYQGNHCFSFVITVAPVPSLDLSGHRATPKRSNRSSSVSRQHRPHPQQFHLTRCHLQIERPPGSRSCEYLPNRSRVGILILCSLSFDHCSKSYFSFVRPLKTCSTVYCTSVLLQSVNSCCKGPTPIRVLAADHVGSRNGFSDLHLTTSSYYKISLLPRATLDSIECGEIRHSIIHRFPQFL